MNSINPKTFKNQNRKNVPIVQVLTFISTLKKQILVAKLNKAKRDKIFDEFRLLACLRDISIVR